MWTAISTVTDIARGLLVGVPWGGQALPHCLCRVSRCTVWTLGACTLSFCAVAWL